jgi:hypothetical protein
VRDSALDVNGDVPVVSDTDVVDDIVVAGAETGSAAGVSMRSTNGGELVALRLWLGALTTVNVAGTTSGVTDDPSAAGRGASGLALPVTSLSAFTGSASAGAVDVAGAVAGAVRATATGAAAAVGTLIGVANAGCAASTVFTASVGSAVCASKEELKRANETAMERRLLQRLNGKFDGISRSLSS